MTRKYPCPWFTDTHKCTMSRPSGACRRMLRPRNHPAPSIEASRRQSRPYLCLHGGTLAIYAVLVMPDVHSVSRDLSCALMACTYLVGKACKHGHHIPTDGRFIVPAVQE